MTGLSHPKFHFRSRRSRRKLSMHPADKQINIEHPHHLLYGSCSKNKSLPLHLMVFYQQHNKSVPSSGVQNVNLGHSFQTSPGLNLQLPKAIPAVQGLIQQTAFQLSRPSPSCRTSLEPRTHLQHLQKLTLRAPESAAKSSEIWAKNQQKCPVQGRRCLQWFMGFPHFRI